jgi:hypothetical protein
MDNHIHLLVKDSLADLSEFMKILFQRYAQYFNLKYKRIGHLFARRFEAKLCLEDSYLLALSRYIHLNPLKAKIIKDPKEYQWSSYSYYVSTHKNSPPFLDVVYILRMFSQDLNAAYHLYEKFIYEGIEKEEGFNYPENIYDVIGDPKKLLELNFGIPLWLEKIITVLDSYAPEKIKDCKGIKDREGRKYLFNKLHKKGFSVKEISELLDCHYSTVLRQICA